MMYRVIFIALFLILSGCATKGYSGATLPRTETSTIYFHSEGRLSFKKKSVNNSTQSAFDSGVIVPAGKVKASVDYQLALYECPMYSMNCLDEVEHGTCEFHFNSVGGRDYGIEMKGAGKGISSRVYDNSTDETVGSGECTKTGEVVHESIMKRRSTIER